MGSAENNNSDWGSLERRIKFNESTYQPSSLFVEYIDQHCGLSHSKQIRVEKNEKIQNSPDTAELLKESLRFHLVETDRFKSISKSQSNLSGEKDQTHRASAGGKAQLSDDRVAYNLPEKNSQSTIIKNNHNPKSNPSNSTSKYIKIIHNQSPIPRKVLRIVPKSSSVQKKNLFQEFSTFHLDSQNPLDPRTPQTPKPKIPTQNPNQSPQRGPMDLSIDSKGIKPLILSSELLKLYTGPVSDVKFSNGKFLNNKGSLTNSNSGGSENFEQYEEYKKLKLLIDQGNFGFGSRGFFMDNRGLGGACGEQTDFEADGFAGNGKKEARVKTENCDSSD